MGRTMILHDTRLEGRTPLNYNFVYLVNANRSISSIISGVAGHARSCGVERGGFGLQLGREGLSLGNVSQTTRWKGLIKTIVVFACATADTAPGNEGTRADGQRLCGELALWSGADVIAARDTQFYNERTASYSRGRSVENTIDFGAWEGPVYRFSRDSGYPSTITPGAYNMASPRTM
ncbi:MAG TPA: hypothetical protein VFB63_21825 [Bryobacteraceae bacterium]|nr:hypothetical protein [Bryobacteraceae bacterium]